MNSENRVLVTGATRGIGRAIAERLACDGYSIALHYHRNHELAEQLKLGLEKKGVKVSCLAFDIGDRAAARQTLENDIKENGAYFGAVLNAAIHKDNAFPALEDDEWDSVVHTNLDGFYNVLKPLVMPMVQRRNGGRIIALSSVSGIMGNRGQTNYAASKAGLIGAAKSLAIELAKRAITVNVVAPGIIDTDMTSDFDPNLIKQIVPLRRMGRVEEVSALVAFLMSDGAAYITRQVISVNGGMV